MWTRFSTWLEAIGEFDEQLRALQRRVEALEQHTEALRECREAWNGPKEGLAADTTGEPDTDASERVFTRLVHRVAPLPLSRIYEFKIGLSDHFWTKTMAASPDELAYVRDHGERLISLTIEMWRSHTVVRSTVLPWAAETWPGPFPINPHRRQTPAAERVAHLYSRADFGRDYALLWELPFDRETPNRVFPFSLFLLDAPPRLELRLEDGALRPCAIDGRFGRGPVPYRDDPQDQYLLLNIPLNTKKLKPFKRPDEERSGELTDDDLEVGLPYRSTAELTCYSHRDDASGIYWELWIHDLEGMSAT